VSRQQGIHKLEADEEEGHDVGKSWFGRFVHSFNHVYQRMLDRYDVAIGRTLLRPAATVIGCLGVFLLSLSLYPLLGVSFFPRTDPGQFVINIKAPTGTRLELTDRLESRSNCGNRRIWPGLSANPL
jgi:multidrug efflux pump subunit AcrB